MWQKETINKHINYLVRQIMDSKQYCAFEFIADDNSTFYCKMCGRRNREGVSLTVYSYIVNVPWSSQRSYIYDEIICADCHQHVQTKLGIRVLKLEQNSGLNKELLKQVLEFKKVMRNAKRQFVTAKRIGLKPL